MSDERHPQDIDAQETVDWLASLDAVLRADGAERARFLLERLDDRAAGAGAAISRRREPYVNTIPPAAQPAYPGDVETERRILNMVRWNAMAMVVRANRVASELGGHLSTYASAASLYEVGFNHVFRGHDAPGGADLLYVQGHSSPGIYARAFIEGRLTETQLQGFRREIAGGLSSYPHPWLMREFWQFATVSMGLGPLLAIYQARLLKYLQNRGLLPASDRKVWAFLGDGEMDEPESTGAISVAVREGLDNLVFVINCNLQRLDGPVRGNGSIIRELAATFRGVGWNVIKVLWGGKWDEYFSGPQGDLLVRRMEEAVDGDYQRFAADTSGRLLRDEFFGKYPELASMVAHLSDEQLAAMPLNRGGHDPRKIYAAYAAARANTGTPTVILFKSVKGHGLGSVAQARNVTHQTKKLAHDAVKAYADWLHLDIPDDELDELPFVKPGADSVEAAYLRQRRQAMGGDVPERRVVEEGLAVPELQAFESVLSGSGDRHISSTMAFVRILSTLLKDPVLGARVVPIVADEARTFGMEGLFRQVGIYAPFGQAYTPIDRDQLAYYREERDGQILQEGISEAGAMSSWIAAATSYANHGLTMVPFYIYYSMFGLQRVGDLAWAAADMQARGFLIGATAGRTTLAGEGLQHQDGHSHLLAATIPNCRAYDPTYGYELAVILQDGLRRMVTNGENVYYYLTALNENYAQPALPKGVEEGILRGLYPLRAGNGRGAPVQLLGSGAILREVEAAADMLAADHGVVAGVWSATSFTELRREAMATRRWNRLHPEAKARVPFVTASLASVKGPFIAATDYMEAFAEQIAAFVPGSYSVLGTDGFGRSDTRAALRAFFEVDRRHVVVAALKALADAGKIPAKAVSEAIRTYDIDPDAPDPVGV